MRVKKKGWSIEYEKCQECGRTEIKHASKGLCLSCYGRKKVKGKEYIPIDSDIETIFKVEPPLKQISDGHGYYGVVLRDKSRDLLQCHICGIWRKGISQHVNNAHQMLSREYKKKFGLPMAFPLVSRETSRKMSSQALKEKRLEHLNKVRNLKKLCSIRGRRRSRIMKYAMNNSAFQNKHGVCEEQIMRRFLVVADAVGKEPSQRDLIEFDHSLWAVIRRRYKTINNFRRKNNFSIVKRADIFTDEQLIAELRKFIIKNKRIPNSSDFRQGSPNVETFRDHFGSWNRAFVLAGLDGKENLD